MMMMMMMMCSLASSLLLGGCAAINRASEMTAMVLSLINSWFVQPFYILMPKKSQREEPWDLLKKMCLVGSLDDAVQQQNTPQAVVCLHQSGSNHMIPIHMMTSTLCLRFSCTCSVLFSLKNSLFFYWTCIFFYTLHTSTHVSDGNTRVRCSTYIIWVCCRLIPSGGNPLQPTLVY